MPDRDLESLMERIRAEAAALRAAAREADLEVAAMAARAREEREERERLSRERDESRSGERAGELGEDRQIGVEPNTRDAPDAER